jgi:hypothetical protein
MHHLLSKHLGADAGEGKQGRVHTGLSDCQRAGKRGLKGTVWSRPGLKFLLEIQPVSC